MRDHDGVGDDPVQHEASGHDATAAAFRTRWLAGAAALVALLAYGWWAVARPPFSASATAAVLVAGVGAAVLGTALCPLHRPVRVPPSGAWLAVFAAAAAWQLAAYLQHPRPDHPTLSFLANELLGSHAARAAAFVLWLVATVRLARRWR